MTERSTTSPEDGKARADAVAPRVEVRGKPAASGPHVVLRVLLGFAGLSLLVGFFLPWLQTRHDDGARMLEHHGLSLALGGDLVGTPAAVLFVVPGLGVLLSAAAFMGFRWSGQLAIGVALTLVGYALYILLHMFVQHTGLGLWVVAGGTFVILLLGVIAWLLESRKKAAARAAGPPAASGAAEGASGASDAR